MELREITYFTEDDGTVIDLLVEFGVKRSFSKVLVYLLSKPESTIRDIERGANLRQPEVSLATTYLLNRTWISCRAVQGGAKGWPVKSFRPAKPFAEILADIKEQKMEEVRAMMLNVRMLQAHARDCSILKPY
jgi:predicted transcriptional regulator